MVMVAVMPHPWVDNEADSLPDHNHESITSRVDADSLEPTYGRKHEAPLPPGKPPPPPPPPPKTFAPLARLAGKKAGSAGGGGGGGGASSCARRCTQETNFETGMYAWSVTSSLYWKLLVVLELVLCLTDIVDDTQVLMYYQRVYILFLVSVAIVIITSLWIYLIYSKQPREASSQQELNNSSDVEGGSFGSLHGTLKRAYIQRHALTTTNFHLRLGAVVFGIATLIYFGFEIAVHTTGGQMCADDIIFTLPIMLVVLCFLQIHFLFVNPQVLFGSMRGPAQFCFAHLLATDVSLWLKTVTSQSASSWVNFLRQAPQANGTKASTDGHLWSRETNGVLNIQTVGGLWWSTRVPAEFDRLAALDQCLRNTTLGQMWLQATPFLVPFLLQFCVVSSAVFYVLWSGMNHVQSRRRYTSSGGGAPVSSPPSPYRGSHHHHHHHHITSYPSNCHLENKGIFVGLLMLVGGVVVLVMYLILRAQPQFVNDSQWVVSGTICIVLLVQILATLMGFLRLQGTPYARSASPPSPLDALLSGITAIGPLMYGVLGLLVAASRLDTNAHLLVMAHCGLLLLQVALQNVFVAERWRRLASRAGRQMVQILLFANAALWLLDTFMTAGGDSQRLQESFYGPLLWGLLAHVCAPLVALYRFHATVQLYELWKRSHA